MRYRRYLAAVAAVAIAAIAAVAAINVAVDPYGIFRLIEADGFNRTKPFRHAGGGRVVKSIALARGAFDTVILGSSRAEVGLDPQSPLLDGARAYNAALAGTNLVELHAAAMFALERQRPRRLIFGLDFVNFTTRIATFGDFEQSGFAGHGLAHMLLRRALSLGALKDAAATVALNYLQRPEFDRADGVHNGHVLWGDKDARGLFDRILEENFLVDPVNYAGYIYGPDRVALLRGVVNAYARSGARVQLFISPVHARQLEALRLLGLFPQYEAWQRDMAAIAEEAAAAAPGRVELWDFGGYNSVTTEPVPERGSGRVAARYWESSHYKPALGDLILARLRDGRSATAPPQDFGRLLSRANIDLHLAEQRQGQRAYRKAEPGEVAAVEELVRRTAKARRAIAWPPGATPPRPCIGDPGGEDGGRPKRERESSC